MKIVHYPHPALRHPARPLTAIDKEVRVQAERMLDLMYEANGLGLAAPQVALTYQMIVVNPSGDPEDRSLERVLLNPVVLERKGSMEGDEGCLSFPGLFQKIRRAKTVKVQAYNLDGESVEFTSSSDLESRLLQHEIDHLHGILFIDKMGTLARFSARGAISKLERDYRQAQQRGEIPPDAEIVKQLEAQTPVL